METTGDGSGNTRQSRPNQLVRWRFVWNNYPTNWFTVLKGFFTNQCKGWIVSEETGETGTPHLQGYFELKKKQRWSELGLPKQIHFDTCDKGRDQNVNYVLGMCEKKGYNYNDTAIGTWARKAVKCLREDQLYPWQKKLWEYIREEPNDREVQWIYCDKGSSGKTAFQKFVLVNLQDDAIMVNGKGADVRCGIARHLDKTLQAPKVVLWNIPRSVEHISYTAIEEIKDGLLFSGKYESGMCLFDPPHILIFANEEPDYRKLSGDRWRITHLQSKQCDSE